MIDILAALLELDPLLGLELGLAVGIYASLCAASRWIDRR